MHRLHLSRLAQFEYSQRSPCKCTLKQRHTEREKGERERETKWKLWKIKLSGWTGHSEFKTSEIMLETEKPSIAHGCLYIAFSSSKCTSMHNGFTLVVFRWHTQREKKCIQTKTDEYSTIKEIFTIKKNYECINCIIVENELDVQWCVICIKRLMWNYKP